MSGCGGRLRGDQMNSERWRRDRRSLGLPLSDLDLTPTRVETAHAPRYDLSHPLCRAVWHDQWVILSGDNPDAAPSGGTRSASRKPDADESVAIARAQAGDPRAFEQLVRRYQQSIYAVTLRILSDPDEAEDAAQNAFVSAWRELPKFRSDAKFSTWLYRIATNQALNQARARGRQAIPADSDLLEARSQRDSISPGHTSDPATHAEQAALFDAVRAALASLPEPLRVCWLLREIQECPYQDIADITQVSLDTARGRIYRARLQLAEAMSAWR